jgi:hypothetical protein
LHHTVKQGVAEMADIIKPSPDQIRQRAYELFVERGGELGRDVDDWLAAEKELYELSLDQVLRAAGTLLSAEQDLCSESQVKDQRVKKNARAGIARSIPPA